ncbi:MAG: hypothetical protein ACLR0N_18695 [Bilophila wadsworthia]
MDPQKLVEHFSMSPHPEAVFSPGHIAAKERSPPTPCPVSEDANFSTGILPLAPGRIFPCTG